MKLCDLTGDQVDALDRETPFILPVVREIPRGPQLPIGIEWTILSSLLDEADGPGVIMPPVHYGVSTRDQGRVGTFAQSIETSSRSISDIVGSILKANFRRILVLTLETELYHQTYHGLAWLPEAHPNSVICAISVDQIVGSVNGNVFVQLAANFTVLQAGNSASLQPKNVVGMITRQQDVSPGGPKIKDSDIAQATAARQRAIDGIRSTLIGLAGPVAFVDTS